MKGIEVAEDFFQYKEVPFDDILRFDNGCFIRPNSSFRRALLRKWFQRGGVTRVALNENDVVVGFGCRQKSTEASLRLIAPLYAESYDIAHDILRSLCADMGEDKIIALEL